MDHQYNQFDMCTLVNGSQPDSQNFVHKFLGMDLHTYFEYKLCLKYNQNLKHIRDDILHMGFQRILVNMNMSQLHSVLCILH